ncbi:hypothetical protein PR002_g14648 [Phytophthora rubi]|nr:hypothetical protein PR002_g14648 [Phytophthora rubi]
MTRRTRSTMPLAPSILNGSSDDSDSDSSYQESSGGSSCDASEHDDDGGESGDSSASNSDDSGISSGASEHRPARARRGHCDVGRDRPMRGLHE